MEKLVVMGGVGEDEMKGKHVLLTTNTINQAAVRASIHRVPPSPEACTAPGGPSNRIQRSQAPTNDSQKDKTLGLVRRREHPSISETKQLF